MSAAQAIQTAVSSSPSLVHGPDSPLVEVLKSVARIAPSESTVLLTGETGTGKEVFARHVHELSSRVKKNFVPVNCGAIPESLLESELFGHVRGAFTGAVTARKGRVAMSEGGTLFLDEIGEMPLALQVKLLRLLQERTYEPVGSAESVTANFRLIAATNRDLAKEVEAGRFRRDLYYRLMVCPIELPALRHRPADIIRLFHHFWSQRGEHRPVDAAVLTSLQSHPWPGNVRELENLVERLSVCSEGAVIRLSDLPSHFRGSPLHLVGSSSAAAQSKAGFEPLPSTGPEAQRSVEVPAADAPLRFPVDLPALLRQIEDAYISAALEKVSGNRKAAADLLGLQRTTLVEKLRRKNRDLPPDPTAAS